MPTHLERRLSFWENDVFADLGELPGFNHESRSVNNSKQIIGLDSGGLLEGRLWENGEHRTLPDVPGGNDSTPNDINELGNVMGASNIDHANRVAVQWVDGELFELQLPDDVQLSYAEAINNSNQYVGCILRENSKSIEGVTWIDGEFYVLNDIVRA